LAPVSLASGTGTLCGRATTWSKPPNAVFRWKTIVVSSGVVIAESVFTPLDLYGPL
jgi:hypothetical protein